MGAARAQIPAAGKILEKERHILEKERHILEKERHILEKERHILEKEREPWVRVLRPDGRFH